MNATDYNCWIKEDGTSNRVTSGLHLCNIEPDDCIRVSMPERRRTWVGIDVYPNATPEAKTTCIHLIRSIRREGLQIRAHIDGTTIEVLPHQRPTTLNKALACIPSPSI